MRKKIISILFVMLMFATATIQVKGLDLNQDEIDTKFLKNDYYIISSYKSFFSDDTLDQYMDNIGDPDAGWPIGGQLYAAQLFRPSKSVLTRIEVYVAQIRSPGSLKLELRSMAGILLGTTKATSVYEGNPGTTGMWVEFAFKNEVYVTPELPYIISLTATGDTDNCWWWQANLNDLYERGFGICCGPDFPYFLPYPGLDFAFKTYGKKGEPPKLEKGDLTLVTPDGEEIKDKHRACVPLNDDDDDDDGIIDRYDTNGVQGEDDLLKIKICKMANFDISSLEISLTLEIAQKIWRPEEGAKKIKVWLDETKTNEVQSGTTFDMTKDNYIYIEGVGTGFDYDVATIKIRKWLKVEPLLVNDWLDIHVFELHGCCNVPDYSKYNYSALYNKADLSGVWESEHGGVEGESNNKAEVEIFWNEGPNIGRFYFRPNKWPDFRWKRDVNIVQVKIENPPNAFVPGTVFDGGNMIAANNGLMAKWVSSKLVGNPGLRWSAQVTLIGPNFNGKNNRGVDHLTVGFIQNGNVRRQRGWYQIDNMYKVSSMEGQHALDMAHDAFPPFYYGFDETTFLSGYSGNNKIIICDDSPEIDIPLYFDESVNPPNPVHRTEILIVFELYIAVLSNCEQTSRTDWSATYTVRAKAQWTFNGNGTVANNPAVAFAWVGAPESGITAPPGWTIVKDGSEPIIKKPTLNELWQSETFRDIPP